MAVEDYTRVITLGPTCTTSFQLKRAVLGRGLPGQRCAGPFDWMGVQLDAALRVFQGGFQGYFEPSRVSVVAGRLRDCWTVIDQSGVISCHQVRRHPGDSTYRPKAWSAFRAWLDERVALLQQALADSQSHVLFLRGEDPKAPDQVDELVRIAESISRLGPARLHIASVAFGEGEAVELAPEIRRFFVRSSWPAHLAVDSVDWNHDYGSGVAWKGIDRDWDRVFSSV